ncbi:MAG: hypothetical protein JXJ20_03685 [Anaerolineae bacterium]|nr:hypothetical protein [Anaerolineae bacterium]
MTDHVQKGAQEDSSSAPRYILPNGFSAEPAAGKMISKIGRWDADIDANVFYQDPLWTKPITVTCYFDADIVETVARRKRPAKIVKGIWENHLDEHYGAAYFIGDVQVFKERKCPNCGFPTYSFWDSTSSEQTVTPTGGICPNCGHVMSWSGFILFFGMIIFAFSICGLIALGQSGLTGLALITVDIIALVLFIAMAIVPRIRHKRTVAAQEAEGK